MLGYLRTLLQWPLDSAPQQLGPQPPKTPVWRTSRHASVRTARREHCQAPCIATDCKAQPALESPLPLTPLLAVEPPEASTNSRPPPLCPPCSPRQTFPLLGGGGKRRAMPLPHRSQTFRGTSLVPCMTARIARGGILSLMG